LGSPNQPVTPVTHDGTGAGVLSALASVNGEISLGLQVGALVLPFAKGVVTAVKKALSGGTETIEYTVAISTGQANLDHAMQVDQEVIDDVNAELARQGVAPLPSGS
jgi:hypothetical protein